MSWRKMKKQPVARYSPWINELEPGDRVYQPKPEIEGAYIYDLKSSRGRDKLTPRLVKKDGKPRVAVMDGSGVWFWRD